MAKRKIAKIIYSAPTNTDKTTTPLHQKVQKLRISVRNLNKKDELQVSSNQKDQKIQTSSYKNVNRLLLTPDTSNHKILRERCKVNNNKDENELLLTKSETNTNKAKNIMVGKKTYVNKNHLNNKFKKMGGKIISGNNNKRESDLKQSNIDVDNSSLSVINVEKSPKSSKNISRNYKYKRLQQTVGNSSSNGTNRFSIKIKRISTKVNSADTLTPRTIKKCAVKLSTTNDLVESSTAKSTNKYNTRLKNLGTTDSQPSNFYKLSLTRLSRKFPQNKESEKDTNLNAHERESNKKHPEESTKTLTSSEVHAEKTSKNDLRVKQIPKLSLKRPRIVKNTHTTDLVSTQFENRENSPICVNENKIQNSSKHKTLNETKTTPSKDRSSLRNLANKSDEIENLLNSLDDEENNCNEHVEEQNNFLTNNMKTCKFFHRNKDNEENMKKDAIPVQNANSKTPILTKKQKQRLFSKRSTVAKGDNIYEFLSQSQTSDSDTAKHADPAADIIKRLIEEGKVLVATNCKGTGKPKFKRKKAQIKRKKIKQDGNKNLKVVKSNTKNVKFVEVDDALEVNDFVDPIDDDEQPDDIGYSKATEGLRFDYNSLIHHKDNNYANELEGTFSRLARKVLINQAGRTDLKNKDQSMLLHMARKFVSTPKNNKISLHQSSLETNLSPIAMAPPRPAITASPWRVNEDSHLPKTFNFCRSSGNLPSFSSDFIPSTPRKDKSKKTEKSPEKSKINLQHNSNRFDQSPLRGPNLSVPSVISSFSSNDSNAENMPPTTHTAENYNENASIFDLKQLPNPRRAFNDRSPLKAINILEIVHLPPYNHSNKTTKAKETSADKTFSSEGNSGDTIREQQQNNISSTESLPKEDIFGFEDFLSQSEASSQENNKTNHNNVSILNIQNQTIHDKLQDLRKLKPDGTENHNKSQNAIRPMPLFDDSAEKIGGLRQRGIKEMLCSTMVHPQPSTSKEALRQFETAHLNNAKGSAFGENLDITKLFKDPESETTFNENEAHRTYIRPYKRKRRLKAMKYIYVLDSEESEDEENSSKEKSDQSLQEAPKQKRHRKDPKDKPELEEFVRDFNSLCKEVEKYKLIIEKST